VNVDAEAVGMKPERLLHPLRAVNRVERRMGMEDNLAVLVNGVLAGLQQLIDVGLLHRVSTELDLDIGEIADEAAGAVARPHVSTVRPDIRSASSTASRTANSLAAMSVMKPRFTPRLSR
jgi:hypothetical protein